MIFTSFVKNKTRNLEKGIQKLKKEVVILEKKLRDARIDFVIRFISVLVRKGQ